MTPQELKNSILQLAVQGKLVEQRAEEGTAEELYKKIKEKRELLIKNGKIRREGKVNNKTDNNKIDIPSTWVSVLLKELVCKKIDNRGKTPLHSKEKIENYIDLLEVNSLVTGHYITRANVEKYISQEVYRNNIRGYVEKDDILIATVGSIGKISLMDDKIGAIAQNIIAIRCFEEIDQKYIFYLLQSPYFYTQMKCVTMEGVQASIKVPDLMNLKVPLPPLEEQKRIVAKVEELLPQIDRYEKAWSKLEEFNKRFPEDMQKSILQYAVQGKLVEQRAEEGTAEELYKKIQSEKQKLIVEKKIKKEKPLPEITAEEIPFDIPESWKWVRLGDIVQLNPKNSVDDEMTTSFIPMKLIDDGYRNNCSYEIKKWGDIKKGFTHFADGDIGVAKITPCFQNRKSVIFKELENGYGAGTTEVSVLRILNQTLEASYILWFLKSDYFIKNGIKSFTGTAGQQRIHKDYLSNCVFPLPPLEEQKRIVAKIEELLPLCEKLKK